MSILKVARLGHPILRQPARDLTLAEIKSPEIQRLIADMVETMHEYGGIGLAAPQVHQPVRLALIEFEADNARYPDMGDQPLQILFNARVDVLDATPQTFGKAAFRYPVCAVRLRARVKFGSPTSIKTAKRARPSPRAFWRRYFSTSSIISTACFSSIG